MKVKSLIKKIYNIYDKKKLKRYKIFDNFYYKKINDKEIKKILIYFPFYEFMHFGDHIFFEPLGHFLTENGFEVKIFPINNMKFYFEKLSYNLGKESDLEEFDLIITRIEFISKLKKIKNNILYIDTSWPGIDKPLSLDLVSKTSDLLGIKLKTTTYIPRLINLVSENEIRNRFNILKDHQYVLFNNYLDSGKFRIIKKHYIKLENYVKNLSLKKNLKIIHTGSMSDKKNDRKAYDYIDIDLRGRTSVEDIFFISQLSNVKYYVGFDAFIMHIFFSLEKKCYVLFRGRFTKKSEMFIKNYVNPSFHYEKDKCNIIEYI